VGNVLQFASYYELYLSVVRNAFNARRDEVTRETDEWARQFELEQGRHPSPQQREAHSQAQSLEVDVSSEDVQHIFQSATNEIILNPSLMGETRNVGNVQAGVQIGFGRVSFEERVDLIYHWVKHKKPGQTLGQYVDEMNDRLNMFIASATFSLTNDQLKVDTEDYRLVVTIRKGIAYVTTYFKKD
jgi:hypothetical protein